jgi:hypothetical protein
MTPTAASAPAPPVSLSAAPVTACVEPPSAHASLTTATGLMGPARGAPLTAVSAPPVVDLRLDLARIIIVRRWIAFALRGLFLGVLVHLIEASVIYMR